MTTFFDPGTAGMSDEERRRRQRAEAAQRRLLERLEAAERGTTIVPGAGGAAEAAFAARRIGAGLTPSGRPRGPVFGLPELSSPGFVGNAPIERLKESAARQRAEAEMQRAAAARARTVIEQGVRAPLAPLSPVVPSRATATTPTGPISTTPLPQPSTGIGQPRAPVTGAAAPAAPAPGAQQPQQPDDRLPGQPFGQGFPRPPDVPVTGPGAGAEGGAGGAAPPGPGIENLAPGGGGSLDEITSSLVGELTNIRNELARPGTSTEAIGIFMAASRSILGLIDAEERRLRSQFEEQGRELDPATQFTLSTLRQRLDEDLSATREDLNRRGLFESGILLDLEQKLRGNALSQEARVLAERLSGLRENLSSRLGALGQERISTAGRFGFAGAEAEVRSQEAERERRQRQQQFAVESLLGLRGQVGRERESALDRTSRERISGAELASRERISDLQRQAAQAAQQADIAARAGDAQREQQWRAQQAELDRTLQRELLGTQVAAGRFERAGPSASAIARERGFDQAATAEALRLVRNAGSRQNAVASLDLRSRELNAAGVDVDALRREIDRVFPSPRESAVQQRIAAQRRRVNPGRFGG